MDLGLWLPRGGKEKLFVLKIDGAGEIDLSASGSKRLYRGNSD
jgi:hypothetical protein